jgi:nucleoside-diphosphate-sugar epimerase
VGVSAVVSPVRRALVTGSAGFLGRSLVAYLRAQGVFVRTFDARPGPAGDEDVVGDLRDADAVARACVGVDTVFHTAALVDWSLNRGALLEAVNVTGTENVLAGCKRAGVARLVFTSTVDVVFDGTPIDGGDESTPIPAHHLDDYGRTKATAEALVLAAHSPSLATCALRVATLWGPDEQLRVPVFAAMAQNGWMSALGDGSARFSHLYVTNAAHAHWLAASALDGVAGGKAYFVADDPPANFFGFYTPILEQAGLPVRWRWIPAGPLAPLAVLSEWANRRGLTREKPLLTRFTLRSTTVDFWFRADRIRQELGYAPLVSLAQAQADTAAWLRASMRVVVSQPQEAK